MTPVPAATPATPRGPVGRFLGWRPAGAFAPPVLLVALFAVELTVWGGHGELRIPGVAPQLWVVPVVELGLAALLLTGARRRAVVQWVVLGLSVAVALLCPLFQPFAAVLVTVHRIARDEPRPKAAPFVLATGAQWAMNTVNATADRSPLVGGAVTTAVITASLWAVITAMVWLAARYARGLAEMAAAREAAAVARGRIALHEQRLELAREIHDVVSHSVSAMILQSAGAQQALDPPPAVRTVLATIETTGTNAMHELRGLLSLLGPAAEPSLPAAGGATDPIGLDELLATVRVSGVAATVTESGDAQPLDAERTTVVRRVLQEGLTNVMRHAGPGAEVTVSLAWQPTMLTITVDSVATAPPATPIGGSSGRGLTGLTDRVAAVGGTLRHGRSGGRYVLRVDLPLHDTPIRRHGGDPESVTTRV